MAPESKLSKAKKGLEKNGFSVDIANSKEELYNKLTPLVADLKTAGFGGSVTTRALGLTELCKSLGLEVFDHWENNLTSDQIEQIRHAHLSCDVFFTSAQAVTLTGEIVSMDGIGNRVAATIFGPKRVIIVCGKNKIVDDLDAAFERIKKVAAPMRAKSLDSPLPCAKTGECNDCDSPVRICRVAIIMYRPPLQTEMKIFLVNEELGY